jgi:hypothetical protein
MPWRRLSLYLSLFHQLLPLMDSVNLTKWILSRLVKKYSILHNLYTDQLIMSDACLDCRDDPLFASCKLDVVYFLYAFERLDITLNRSEK